jgi:hypothetical protein
MIFTCQTNTLGLLACIQAASILCSIPCSTKNVKDNAEKSALNDNKLLEPTDNQCKAAGNSKVSVDESGLFRALHKKWKIVFFAIEVLRVINKCLAARCLLEIFFVSRLEEENDSNRESSVQYGEAKPMLPYSSMFIFGPTNPYVVSVSTSFCSARSYIACLFHVENYVLFPEFAVSVTLLSH